MQEIRSIIYSMFEAFQNGDTKRIESFLHKDASVWDVFTPELIVGEKNLNDFHQLDQQQKISRGPLFIEVEKPIISNFGSLCLALYCVNFAYQEPNALTGKVRVTDVFIKENNQWKIVHHHEGLVPDVT